MEVTTDLGFWKTALLVLFLAMPVLLTISDVVHRMLVGLKLQPWYTLFGLFSLLPRFRSGDKNGGFGGFGGGGFGGGGASGGW